jgi:hypothetical protein
MSKNELKHLLHPDTGQWIPEYDTVLVSDSACTTCIGAVAAATIHTVDSAKKCFLYGLLVSNVTTDTDATYAILSGDATVKIPPIYIIRNDVHDISRHPKAPIAVFGTAEVIKIRTSGATINCLISFWEAEIEGRATAT